MELDDAAIGLTEMMYSRSRQQLHRIPDDATKALSFSRQFLPMSSSFDPAEHIKVGSFYEIDHSRLPSKSPDQLNSIRVIMVNEKTRSMRISLRYPSLYSLRTYFDECKTTKRDAQKLPAFDEKYIMASEIAAEVLYRRIPPHEISEKRKLWRFWAIPSIASRRVFLPSPYKTTNTSPGRPRGIFVSKKKGSLLSELKGSGMVSWGQRRQVRFLARHVDDKPQLILSKDDEEDNSMEAPSEEEKDQEATEDEEENGEEEGEEEEEGDVKEDKSPDVAKRKQPESSSRSLIKRKMPKRGNKDRQIVVNRQKKQKVLKNSIDRWSAQRYKLAEVNMLRIMKEKDAAFGNPVLRSELRAEARKLIGDTGLLDHLLKHMSGKVAPGGEERFRRRHNADGAMEYWLEKADLVDIRKEAGVKDPYWIPPPGWKPGDNPIQDPICAQEIKDLREVVAKLKKDMEELVSKRNEEQLCIVPALNPSLANQNMEHHSLLIPLKEMYVDLVNKKAKIEEQLLEISQSLKGMEEGVEKLKTRVDESNSIKSLERLKLLTRTQGSTPSTGNEKVIEPVQQHTPATTPEEVKQDHCREGGNKPQTGNLPTPREDKAARIERLKSGFKICKPQATFLWPDMTISSPQAIVHLGFSTPQSASSTSVAPFHILSASPSYHRRPLPDSPVKTLSGEKLAGALPSTALTTPIPHLPEITRNQKENSTITIATPTTTSTRTPLINLNELPINPNENTNFESQSTSLTSPYPVTYQRRHQQIMVTTTAFPCSVPSKQGNDESL